MKRTTRPPRAWDRTPFLAQREREREECEPFPVHTIGHPLYLPCPFQALKYICQTMKLNTFHPAPPTRVPYPSYPAVKVCSRVIDHSHTLLPPAAPYPSYPPHQELREQRSRQGGLVGQAEAVLPPGRCLGAVFGEPGRGVQQGREGRAVESRLGTSGSGHGEEGESHSTVCSL